MTQRQMYTRILVIGLVLIGGGIANIFLTMAGHRMLSLAGMGSLDIVLLGYLFICLSKYIRTQNARPDA